jgi:Fe-S-cluster containining protein
MIGTSLVQIQQDVWARAESTIANLPEWPCRKGCDDCCRSLAAVPRVSRDEWASIAAALDALPADAAEAARQRIRVSASASRPVLCPLLDIASGSCLVYEARPVACRAYGFYAERERVLGCHRIESLGREVRGIVWGNHETLEDRLRSLGPAVELSGWLSVLETE